mmetsp:Transcript_17526/g.25936  ORF Transcript_17526/g.25936 Transcript_17526/m.25936 type:complete len:243 (-) Transcript_17526:395-1123(-)|eukprot:CAMPEP_0194199074 /NCGR_PEP_ID=MMETSP0156-20130528/230_1 /TAXON_ID=33649 /ORGANISM="Thalassionema nitzschioides, Strain L26-B" /LENGTH=242 /DNA_ID=CAMNT_0038923915 /DNA_START=150 /DNA_END=878 /DNA_ORIENTATION=-
MASKRLTKFLTTPSKIASALEWNKLRASVLALDIRPHEIGLTLASHPQCGTYADVLTIKLESLPLTFGTSQNKKVVDSSVATQLEEIVRSHKVCGFVVNWPLQKEGRLGASCGRVLHALDSILEQSAESPIFSPHRKFCLWDGAHVEMEQDDSFGRCSLYGTPSTEAHNQYVHLASIKQYDQKREKVDIWDDFCHNHWPMLFEKEQSKSKSKLTDNKKDVVFDNEWLDDFDENDGFMQASAL